jgi:uncharacterized protein (TIGR02597 family)
MMTIAALSVATAQAAQQSNIVGYHTVTVLGNSDAIVSSPFDNAAGAKTFDQMFPANLSGLSYSNSLSGTAAGRRTEVLVLNYDGIGENKSAANTFFYFNNGWRRQGAPLTVNFGPSNVVSAAQYVLVRNTNNSTPLTHVSFGNLASGEVTASIPTAAVKNDLYVSPGRATALTFADLQLGGTPAFASSTTATAAGRRDEVLVFDNTAAGVNKSSANTFFYFNNGWRRQGSPATVDFSSSNAVAGATGFLIRKAGGTPGAANWTSIPTY